ncbi:MAG TPA: cytochrome c554 family protein [Nitrospirae bacterium]|nr:hypothetical protein BMS3Abin10_01966 [bacterium BMS3Abin10]GBE38179.1 hypothetical protein BMS3Bbin08_00782 [bacterium BMS3Bbin08]HDH51043.1 cytochrome c554 family protein [Nitrospirota bacterium]HDK16843.1 cytochrome c554 family protein [Nitrospirota bacterium]HDZ84834.1 cytochrome c554 family protein [Nitrospirota bacterium]
MKKIVLALAVFFIMTVIPASAQQGKELFERKCDKCHSLDRPLSMDKDLEAWKRTAKRMSGYIPGLISDEDVGKIADYLAGRDRTEKTIVVKGETIEEIKDTEEHGIFQFKKVRVDQFIDPEICASCHPEKFEQWNGSMHSKAFTDPLWRSATKLFFKDAKKPGEVLEMKACVKCHTPLGFRSYSISSPADDYDKLAELPAQGIFCNWCHNISEVRRLGNAGYEVEPGGGEDDPSTMLGPFKDSDSPYHPTRYSELHTKSDFCGLCHNVSHTANELPIEQTYEEWKNGPYNTGDPATTVNCQDCHMRQRPGVPSTGKTARPDNPGRSCINGPERKHVWTHYFVGANAVVTKLLGSEKHAAMAVERLQNAADLEIIKSGQYGEKKLSTIKIKVINSGAGHYLPTGLTEVRQMWLDIKITDAAGKTVLRSGSLDKSGKLDENAVLYHTQLGDENGKSVINVALADRILYDHRVPPKGYVIERYSFYISPDAVSPLKVEAVLKYRSVSQPLARKLLGKDAPEIPVIDMVKIVDEIKF